MTKIGISFPKIDLDKAALKFTNKSCSFFGELTKSQNWLAFGKKMYMATKLGISYSKAVGKKTYKATKLGISYCKSLLAPMTSFIKRRWNIAVDSPLTDNAVFVQIEIITWSFILFLIACLNISWIRDCCVFEYFLINGTCIPFMIFSGLEIHGTVNKKLNVMIIAIVTRCLHLGLSGFLIFSQLKYWHEDYAILGICIYFVIWDIIRIILQAITIQKIRGSLLPKSIGLIQFEIIVWSFILILQIRFGFFNFDSMLILHICSCLMILVVAGFEINGILKKNLFIMVLACIIRCIHFGGILFMAINTQLHCRHLYGNYIICDYDSYYIIICSCVSILIWDLLRFICQAKAIHQIRRLKNSLNDVDFETPTSSSDYEELINEENDFTEQSVNDYESGTPSLPAYDDLANEDHLWGFSTEPSMKDSE